MDWIAATRNHRNEEKTSSLPLIRTLSTFWSVRGRTYVPTAFQAHNPLARRARQDTTSHLAKVSILKDQLLSCPMLARLGWVLYDWGQKSPRTDQQAPELVSRGLFCGHSMGSLAVPWPCWTSCKQVKMRLSSKLDDLWVESTDSSSKT